MKNKDFVTVFEFAKLAGVSYQSVYKKLNQLRNPLNQYTQLIDNKKMINLQALSDIYDIKIEQYNQSNTQPVEHKVDVSLELIETLKEQLQQKDKQIDELNQTIKELNSRLSELNKIIDQQQQLQLLEKQEKLLLIENKEESVEEEAKKKWWQIW